MHHDIVTEHKVGAVAGIGNYRESDDRSLSDVSQSKWPLEGPDENQTPGRTLE